MSVAAQSVPLLRRGVRRHFDATRAQHVLQGPERVILLDDIANAIIELCDGTRDVATIAQILAQRYAAEQAQVQPDVTEFIAALYEKGLVTL